MNCYDQKRKTRFRADASWERLKVAHTTQVTFLENTLTNRRFLHHIFFFHRCVVEITFFFSWSKVSMAKAMYQRVFFSKIA